MAGKKDAAFETMTVKLDMKTHKGKKKLARLIADGWETADRHEKGALEWGYKTEFILRRERV